MVIVGGGFGGLEAAKALRGSKVRVTLVDRRNHHVFQPLLYQVATAALNPANIASPIRRILRGVENVEVWLGDVESVDVPAKALKMADSDIHYDYLIVATGATHSYFGHDEWAVDAPGLKSIEDATAIRRRILLAFEAAEREPDPRRRREWTTFVVVGAGPTGVELAGALAEIARHDLVHEFHHINPARSRVILLEAGPRVLPAYPEDLSAKAQKQLEGLGVDVRVGTKVTGVDEGGVSTEGGQIAARTVLWGAGVQGSPLAKTLGVPLDRAGRVKVEPDLTIPGHPEVFVVGDLAALEQDGNLVPGVAPAAMQGGKYAAKTILATLSGKPRKPFRYSDKGVARHDRPARGRRPDRQGPPLGLHRLDGLVVDPRLLPDRLPKPTAGDARMGLALRVPRSRRAADHRSGRGPPGARPFGVARPSIGGRGPRLSGPRWADVTIPAQLFRPTRPQASFPDV